jgi:translation initiation factor 3 subunit I
VQTGEELYKFEFSEPCRAVKFAPGDRMVAITTDPFMNKMSAIQIYDIADDPSQQTSDAKITMTGPRGRISRVEWADDNKTLISASEDGYIRKWDVETGKIIAEAKIHDKHIMDLQMSTDGSHFATASNDRTAKLVDADTLEVLKTYKSTVPVNSAAISPIFDHILIGGGQEASQVTTTSAKAGKFESRFFHKIFEEEIANVRGHFGPINAVAFSPDGTMFVSGGEEGYVRLHHLDAAYFETGKAF